MNRMPKLRFKEFTDEWEEKKLENIVNNISSGKTKIDKDENGKYPLYGSTGQIGFTNSKDYTGENILIARVGANAGTLNIVNEECGITDNTLITSVNKYNINKWLYYYLINYNLNRLIFGSGQPLITGTQLKKINILIPNQIEQQKIADFLSSVDKKISITEEKLDLFKDYKKGIMQKIFNQELRFKDSNGNDYPEWEEKKLGNISKIYDGTHQTPNYVEKGVSFFSVENITNNNFFNTKYVTEETYIENNKKRKIEKNDILMTRIGSIGESKLIDWDIKADFYVSLALIKLEENNNSSYINQFIKTDFFQKELDKRTLKVAFPQKINLSDIGECLVKLPCLEEQEKIANFLSSVDNKIDNLTSELENLKEFKKGLLQQMFV